MHYCPTENKKGNHSTAGLLLPPVKITKKYMNFAGCTKWLYTRLLCTYSHPDSEPHCTVPTGLAYTMYAISH